MSSAEFVSYLSPATRRLAGMTFSGHVTFYFICQFNASPTVEFAECLLVWKSDIKFFNENLTPGRYAKYLLKGSSQILTISYRLGVFFIQNVVIIL